MEWARDMQNPDIQRVASTTLSNGVCVSTVWLGLDHRFGLTGRPLIFETMLFLPTGDTIGEQWRYSTEEEAVRGHKTLVKKWSKFKNATQLLDEIRQEKNG